MLKYCIIYNILNPIQSPFFLIFIILSQIQDWTKDFIVREPGFGDHVNIRVEALMPKVVIIK